MTHAALKDLKTAGTMLANCAYNLVQRGNLTERDRQALDESRKEWDAAIAALSAMEGEAEVVAPTFCCDYCGSDYTREKYCCQRRREYMNAHNFYEAPTRQAVEGMVHVGWFNEMQPGSFHFIAGTVDPRTWHDNGKPYHRAMLAAAPQAGKGDEGG